MKPDCIDHGLKGNQDGYGNRYRDGRMNLAHRLVYADKHGLSREEMPPVVRHTCDNPRCINPDHLLGGTHLDNMRDMRERGRSHGALPSIRRLTDDQEREIFRLQRAKAKRSRENSTRKLAAMYGVDQTTIVNACKRVAASLAKDQS